MKKIKIALIIVVMLIAIVFFQSYVQAAETIVSKIDVSSAEIKQGESIEITFAFKDYEEIDKGINAYKATLEYDENIFEEIKVSDFQSLNLWEEFLYNPENHQFIAIKKAGTKTEEDIVKLKLKVKSDAKQGDTTIKISDIVTSEGKRDIAIDDSQVNVKIIKVQNTTNPDSPDNNNGSSDSNNNSGTTNNTNNNNNNNNNTNSSNNNNTNNNNSNNNSNNSNSNTKTDNTVSDIKSGKLPYTGLNNKSLIILIIIEIFIVIAVISYIKIKNPEKKISKKVKIITTIILAVVLILEIVVTIYAVMEKGELNGDDNINYEDVVLLERHLINLETLAEDKLNNADMNSDSKITVTDLSLLVQKIENNLDYTVDISSKTEEFYPGKNQEIELKFTAQVSYEAKIDEVIINEETYKVTYNSDTNEYSVKVKSQSNSGLQEFKFTKAKLDVGKEVDINFVETIDVLKDMPSIENYQLEELVGEKQIKITFDIKDNDNSIYNSYMIFSEKNDTQDTEKIKEEQIKVGQNEFVLDVEEEKNYNLYIYLNYNLDSDKLTEHEKDNTGIIADVKDINLVMDYKLKFEELKIYNENGIETQKFSKNEPIILKFKSTNTTKYVPTFVTINGNKYNVVAEENNIYSVKIDAINEVGENELKFENIILENGKKIELQENNIAKVIIQKEKPEVEGFKLVENENNIQISFKIKDEDQTITNKKVILKDAEDVVIFEQEISGNEFNQKISIPEKLTTQYKVDIIADYDITTDNSEPQKEQVIYTNTILAIARVNVVNSSLSKTEFEKGENVSITYNLTTNKKEEIEKVIVNSIEAPVTKNADNTYTVTVPVGNTSGKQKLELSKVIFSDSEEVNVSNTLEILVLKSVPVIKNYLAEDNYYDETVKFQFEVEDIDNAFVSGKVQLVNKAGEEVFVQEFTEKSGLNFEISVKENEEYTFKVLLTYSRDEEGTKVIDDEVSLEKPIQMITDYKLSVTDIKTKNAVSNTETKYFNRAEKIKLVFTSTNATKFFPEEVQVNGKTYVVTKLQDNQYEILVDEITSPGLAELKIEKIWMNNTKEFTLTENNTAKIEILKNIPNVINFKYEELENNKIKAIFEIQDEEQTILNTKFVVSDEKAQIYEQTNLVVGKNEVIFDPTTSEKYVIQIFADYDLDTNSLEEGKNEFYNQEIEKQEIEILQELIELKDVTKVQLYTKSEDAVQEITQINVNNFEPNNYIAKVTMKELPVFYSEIEESIVEGNKFNLVLKYDNVVQYEGNTKTNEIKVTFGEINNDIVNNLTFEDVIEIIQNNQSAEINLTNDLDANDVSVATSTYFQNFTGIINGNGHTIKNITKPLFNKLENAEINGLVIENAIVSGNSGILANQATETKINDVHIKNSSMTSTHASGTGGFIGIAESNTIIENCSANNLKVSGSKRVGGYTGYLNTGSEINNCYIQGTIVSTNDAIGGIVGQSSGSIKIQNTYSDVEMENSVAYANAGIIGYVAGNAVTLTNNISLADGNRGTRIIGSTTSYTSSSKNNYEIEESQLSSNNNNNNIKVISKEDINEEFFKVTLNWDSEIWRLEDISADKLPTLKNSDPADESNKTDSVTAENANVYIPDIARLRKMSNYDTNKEIAYHNMNLLMPFYDAKLYVEYGNKIDSQDILNTAKIKMIIPYGSDNKMIAGINTGNYNQINKIRVIFENEEVKEYELQFKKKLSDIAVYTIKDLNINYIYNNFILNTNITTVNEIIEMAKQLDYSTHIQTVTQEEESRLYVDYYNESVKDRIPEVITNIISNEDEYNMYLDNEILKQKIKEDMTNNSRLEKTIYTYNYFDKWYNMQMGDCRLSDVIFLNVNNINNNKTISSLVNATMQQGESTRKVGNPIGFFNNVIKSELGDKDIAQFLEYFMKVLADYDDPNQWFTDNFKGMINETPAVGQEDTIRYRAWALMKARNHLILPILSAPQEDMYIISVPSQIVIGSMNRYDQYINGNIEGMKTLIDNYAKMIGNFYGVSATFINNAASRLNVRAHVQYDTRFNFPGSGTQEAGKTQDPVMKWVYEPIGSWGAANGSGAYANGTDVYWTAYQALGGGFSFSVFTHETAHNQDGYYFYEEYYRRNNTWAEDHADANIAQDLGDGSLVFNISRDRAITLDDSNNLKMARISGPENIYSYYKEMFETYYVLDYLTGQAFLQLTPEEQAKVAVQVYYDNSTDYEVGGSKTTYKQITADEFSQMNLKNMEDLWNNRIALRGTGSVGDGGAYGGDTHYSIYWYQPHNDVGRPDSYSFKRLGFEMLGVGGYSDGYVTYRSGKSSNDLDALRKITQNDTITWKEYKMNRYKTVEANLDKILYFDPQEVISLYKEALQKDAINGNRNNTNQLRKLLYGVIKRATKDFSTGGIYSVGVETEIDSAEKLIQVLSSEEWGNYKLTNDLDFSNITPGETAYITKTFVGRINGNGYKIKGLTKTLFENVTYIEIQNLIIEGPRYNAEVGGILANSGKHIILDDVVVNQCNVNLPFVKSNTGITKWMGSTKINVKSNEISTIEDLLEIENSENPLSKKMTYELVNDIDMSTIDNVNAIISGSFEGKINGNGHTLSNLKAPLFETLTGSVSDLCINNFEVKKTGTNNIAPIAGRAQNASLSNIKVDNVTIEGRDNISAIVGYSQATTYSKISATNINIKALHYYAGGIVGRSFDSTYTDVLVTGTLDVRDTHNGGVIGALNRDKLKNIYSKIDVVRTSVGDSRNKNAGLYGAIENGAINVENAIVVGNMSETLYKVTPADTDTEISNIGKYLTNVYEYEESTGISNSDVSTNILKATKENIQDKSFYTDILKFSEDIWDFSNITFGGVPNIK